MEAPSFLVVCDGVTVPSDLAQRPWTAREELWSSGPGQNIHLYGENRGQTVLTSIDDRYLDLIHLASYVYAADQQISRGGVKRDVFNEKWRRRITLCVPVADPSFWSRPAVVKRLRDALHFATDDQWNFQFAQAPEADEGWTMPILEGEDEAKLLGQPDCVALFSGGADSLCAVIAAVVEQGRKPLLVSHSSALPTSVRQRDLVGELRRRFREWSFPYLRFPISRTGKNPADTSQRSRPFLFASLGAAVAAQLGIEEVLLSDNGIVSLNLFASSQAPGALSSRTTHPTFIRLFNNLAGEITPRPVRIVNSLRQQTRAEALKILCRTGAAALLTMTLSCAHWRLRPKEKPQCGYCSQCVDRRFGAIAAGLAEYDPPERYGMDVFHDGLGDGEPRMVAFPFVTFAQELCNLDDDGVLHARLELEECIPWDETTPRVSTELVDLLRRHSAEVLQVVATVAAELSLPLVSRRLAPDCLLALVLGGSTGHRGTDGVSDGVRLEGDYWALTYNGSTIRVKTSRGMRYIVAMLRSPGERLEAAALVAAETGATSSTLSKVRAMADGMEPSSNGADEIMDRQYVAEVRQEMEDLAAKIKVATAQRQEAEADRLRAVFNQLAKEVKAKTGPGGRRRAFPNPGRRAQDSVGRAVREARDHIEQLHPSLGQHLRRAIDLGRWCSYSPSPDTRLSVIG